MATMRCPSAPQTIWWHCHQNLVRAKGHPSRAAAMTVRSAFGDGEVSPRSPEIKVAVPPNLVGRGDHRAVLYFRKRLHYRSSRHRMACC